MVRCCKNCKWLEHNPRTNSNRGVAYFCLKSGMTICSADIGKDLTKYEFSQKWERDNCMFEPNKSALSEENANEDNQ